jgi:hypothetical protein
MRVIMTAANFSPAGSVSAAPIMMATSGFQRSWVHIHSIIPRTLRQRATHNIDMAVETEEGKKQAHGRIQSTLPDNEGHDDGSCGGRAGRVEPVLTDLCLRNRRGARSRGDGEGHGDCSSGGRAGWTEPV